MQDFFWSWTTAAKMARPAPPSPKGPRRVLSAGSLLRNTSLQPIIASRGRGSKDPAEESSTTRLSQVRYANDRSSVLSTPRNMYDYEDSRVSSSTAVPSYTPGQTRINRLDDNYHKAGPPPVFYNYKKPRPRPRPPDRLHVPRAKWDDEVYWLRPSCCYILLKVLELAVCLIVLVISRVGAGDFDLDLLHTVFGAIGFLVSGTSLLILWVKGHPAPGDCLHTLMLLCYGIAVPILLCGAIMVLLQTDTSSVYVAVLATLFFLGVVLFTFDVIVMAVAILQCWKVDPYPTRPIRTHPVNGHGYDDDDDYYYYDDYRHSFRRQRPNYYNHRSTNGHPANESRYPSDRYPSNGYPRVSSESAYPTSVPQMRVAGTWHDGYPEPISWRA